MGRTARWSSCGLLFALLPASAAAQLDGDPDPSTVVEVQPRVERAFETQDKVLVFLILREDSSISQAQDAVLSALGTNFELGRRYRNIPAVAGLLSRAGLARVRTYPGVVSVQLDGTGSGGLAQAVPAAGVDEVQSMRGLKGEGVTVAVLDSGASTTHPALQGAIVGQHCFTQFACMPFGNEGDSAEDDHNHGSNVTGIIASRGAGGVAVGYAPASKIVSVKVLNSFNAGQVSDWVAGFDWVMTNREMLDIKVINASLCSTAEYATASQCDSNETALAMITKKLVAAGVPITVSSGNTGHTMTMTAPACNTGVIAVGATYDSDLGKQPEQGGTYQALGGGSWPACSDPMTSASTIACFTSTAGERLDLLAPGSQLSSVGRGTGTSLFRGTSQAAPGVAGLAALMLECNPMLTPAEILDVLKMTGKPVMDPRSGMTYPLISGLDAVDMACPDGTGGTGGSMGAGTGGMAGMSGMGGMGGMGGTAGDAMGGMGGGTNMTGGSSAAGTSGATAPPMAGGMGGVAPAGGSGAGTAGTAVPAGGAAGGLGGGGAPAPSMMPAGPIPAASNATEDGCGCSVPGARTRTRPAWWALAAVALVGFARRRSRAARS